MINEMKPKAGSPLDKFLIPGQKYLINDNAQYKHTIYWVEVTYKGKDELYTANYEFMYDVIWSYKTEELIQLIQDGNFVKSEGGEEYKGVPIIRAEEDFYDETDDVYEESSNLSEILQEIQTEQYQIYCDMDGVLTDFSQRYEHFTGMKPEEMDAELQKQYGKNKGQQMFWQKVDPIGLKFWSEMKWMPDGHMLWNYIEEFNPKLLSSPSRSATSRQGKQEWVDKYLSGTELILRYASKKQEFAGPNNILIDDRADNVKQWIAKGGIGILHKSASQTINELKKLGFKSKNDINGSIHEMKPKSPPPAIDWGKRPLWVYGNFESSFLRNYIETENYYILGISYPEVVYLYRKGEEKFNVKETSTYLSDRDIQKIKDIIKQGKYKILHPSDELDHLQEMKPKVPKYDQIPFGSKDFYELLNKIKNTLGNRIEHTNNKGNFSSLFMFGTIYNDAISFSFHINDLKEEEKNTIEEIINDFDNKHFITRAGGIVSVNIYDNSKNPNIRIGLYHHLITNSGGQINEMKPKPGNYVNLEKGKIYNIRKYEFTDFDKFIVYEYGGILDNGLHIFWEIGYDRKNDEWDKNGERILYNADQIRDLIHKGWIKLDDKFNNDLEELQEMKPKAGLRLDFSDLTVYKGIYKGNGSDLMNEIMVVDQIAEFYKLGQFIALRPGASDYPIHLMNEDWFEISTPYYRPWGIYSQEDIERELDYIKNKIKTGNYIIV